MPKLNVPILPVPKSVKLAVVEPLKVPPPVIVFATPVVPIVKALVFKSKISAALLKVIALPAFGAEIVKALAPDICNVVLPDAG